VGFTLRVWGLADHSIWWDEGIGVWLSRMPALEAVRWTAGDVHPPLFYLFLIGWRALVGEGAFVLRFLSVIFSTLTIPVIFRLGKALGGARTGALAAGVLTVSRFSIWWAQEIRMYAPAALLATGSLWSSVWLWRAIARTERQALSTKRLKVEDGIAVPWVVYTLTTLGSLSTLYLTATVPVVTNLGFLAFWWHQRRDRRRAPSGKSVHLWPWISAQIAVVALFLPWAAYALPRMHSWSSDAPFTPAFFIQLYTTILAVGDPLNLEAHALLTTGVFIGLALGVIALVHVLRPFSVPQTFGVSENPKGSLQPTTDTSAPSSLRVGGLTMLLTGLLLPPLAVMIVSLPGLSFYFSRPLVPRYLLPLSACYATLLAWGIDALWTTTRHRLEPMRWLAVATAGMTLAAAVAGLRTFYPSRTQRDDYITIAEVLNAHRRVDEAVLLYVDRDWPIFVSHYAGLRTDLPYGAALSDPAVTEALLRPVWDQTAAIWLVSTPESLQADPLQTVPQWLAAHSVMSRTVVSGEASLIFYTRTPDRVPIHETIVPGYVPPAVRGPSAVRGGWAYGLVGAFVPLPRYTTGDTLHLGLYWIPTLSEAPLPSGARVEVSHSNTSLSFPVPPVGAMSDIVRNQVDIPLTPDMPGGSYRLNVVVPGHPPTLVGAFTLVRKAAGAAVDADTIPSRVNVHFGDGIRLIGYALPRSEMMQGESVALTLYWQAEDTIETRYKVFTHLVGETFNAESGNFLWGQQDNEPVNGQAPTTQWASGTVIADPYLIPVSPHAPPGDYTLAVGLYGLVDGARLPAEGPEGIVVDDAVWLATVTVRR
jgi:4-amino-4-deoxy-L-arabinose transferase-like glycosyltransferase